jgi:hypothetical protein
VLPTQNVHGRVRNLERINKGFIFQFNVEDVIKPIKIWTLGMTYHSFLGIENGQCGRQTQEGRAGGKKTGGRDLGSVVGPCFHLGAWTR